MISVKMLTRSAQLANQIRSDMGHNIPILQNWQDKLGSQRSLSPQMVHKKQQFRFQKFEDPIGATTHFERQLRWTFDLLRLKSITPIRSSHSAIWNQLSQSNCKKPQCCNRYEDTITCLPLIWWLEHRYINDPLSTQHVQPCYSISSNQAFFYTNSLSRFSRRLRVITFSTRTLEISINTQVRVLIRIIFLQHTQNYTWFDSLSSTRE